MPRPTWHIAASFAAEAHRTQVRKNGRTPFIAHPFRVAMIVRDQFGCDDDVALSVALLHDVIEDTPADYDDIESAFGQDVADCVAALTKNMTLPEPVREPEYDARLAQADWRARLVKLADTYDNLLDRYDHSFKAYRKMVSRCQRAIDLAQPDLEAHEPTRRGVAALQRKIDQVQRILERRDADGSGKGAFKNGSRKGKSRKRVQPAGVRASSPATES